MLSATMIVSVVPISALYMYVWLCRNVRCLTGTPVMYYILCKYTSMVDADALRISEFQTPYTSSAFISLFCCIVIIYYHCTILQLDLVNQFVLFQCPRFGPPLLPPRPPRLSLLAGIWFPVRLLALLAIYWVLTCWNWIVGRGGLCSLQSITYPLRL